MAPDKPIATAVKKSKTINPLRSNSNTIIKSRVDVFIMRRKIVHSQAHAQVGAERTSRTCAPNEGRATTLCTNLTSISENLSGVEDILRVEGQLDVPHQFQILGSVLLRQIAFLGEADAVLAGHLSP